MSARIELARTDRRGQGPVEGHLRARRDGGRKLLMPYVTGGISSNWLDHLRAFADAGADVIEVGLPFSDPTLDGVTIQQATHVALARGATVRRILDDVVAVELTVPLVASVYCNLVVRDGAAAFCDAVRAAGFGGLIVPDLPMEEAGEVEGAAASAGVDLALLAAPTTPSARLAEIAGRSRGFVYAVSVMGTTGERRELADSATDLGARLMGVTDRPVLLGFGISTPEQAVQATRSADGVVIGAAIMRKVLDGADPTAVGAYLSAIRGALDRA